ncbi:hypothetical protein [Aquabacterium sp.]|uniref:hypothetical protein n=1 Tax=Aquabacterium sp. TaxID=1872578 RepID=UPI003782D80F
MKRRSLTLSLVLCTAAVAQAQGAASAPAATPGGPTIVYRCPGNLYTSELTPKMAEERNCRPIEAAPVTVVQMPKPRPAAAKPSDAKVDPAAQRERDNDARAILESELRREEDKLAALKREYNNGEPDRRGDERNYQTYLDRVSALKASITRSESDIAAIKRELAKIQP